MKLEAESLPCTDIQAREEAEQKPCRGKSRSSAGQSTGRRNAAECSAKSLEKRSCVQLMGIVNKYKQPNRRASSSKNSDVSDEFSTFKFRKFRKSETDFAQDLNRFIDREVELRCSGMEDEGNGDAKGRQTKIDLKLKIFQEAFYVVQQNVPSYRNVLARMRQAYDEAIRIRDYRLQEFDTMRMALLKMQKDVESQKEAIWEDAMARVIRLLREKLELIRVIDSVNENNNNLNGIICELSKELETSHSKLLEEIDTRRLIAYECSQLSNQVEILRNKAKVSVQNAEKTMDADNANDPVVLELALTKCREALAKAQARVTYMETVYDNVCPLRDYEHLMADYKELTNTNLRLTGQITTLEKQIQTLKRRLEDTGLEKKYLLHKMEKLEQPATPRLDWNLCARFVPGGLEEWHKATLGKTSQEKFSIFLDRMAGYEPFEDLYFTGLGTGADVPPHLKYSGQVYNRKYWLRDVRVIINHIWKMKLASNNEHPMVRFLMEYAESSFPVASLQAELIYNLVEGCKKYLHDPQVKLFYGILQGELPEDLYRAQYNEMELLRQRINAKLTALRSKNFLTGAAFCETIRSTFPLKSETDIMALLEAATAQLGISIGKNLDMVELFKECEEGLEQRELGKEMGEQFRAAQKKYASEVLQCVTEIMAEEKEEVVKYETAKRAFEILDVSLSESQKAAYLKCLFSSQAEPITLATLAERLERSNIRRLSPNTEP